MQSAYEKSGQTKTVPLNSPARLVLEKLGSSKGDHVFSKTNGTPYRSIRNLFKSVCEHAGLEDVTPHTLRHTFASRLAMAGVDLRTIQELGGWKDLSLVERYAHLTPNHIAKAVELIAHENFTTLFTTPEIEKVVTVR